MLHLIERMLNLDAGIDNQQYSKLEDFPLVFRNPSTLPRGRNIESDPNAVGVIRASCTQLALMKPRQKARGNRAENDKICICLDTYVNCAPDLKESDTESTSEYNLRASQTQETNILLKRQG